MKEPTNVSTSVVLNNFIRSVSISVLRLILFHVHIWKKIYNNNNNY